MKLRKSQLQKPLLSAKQLDCALGTDLHPAYKDPQDGRYMDPYAVRDIYETQRAKDQELLQKIVEALDNFLNKDPEANERHFANGGWTLYEARIKAKEHGIKTAR